MSASDQRDPGLRERLQNLVEILQEAEAIKAHGLDQETFGDALVASKIWQLLATFVGMFRQATRLVTNESSTYIQQKLDLEEEQRQDLQQLPSFAAKFDEVENPKMVEKCKGLRERFQFVLSILFELQQLGQRFQILLANLPPGNGDEIDSIESYMSEISALEGTLLQKYFVPNELLPSDERPEVICVLCNEAIGHLVFGEYRAGVIRSADEIQSCASIEMFVVDPRKSPLSPLVPQNLTAVSSIPLERNDSCFVATVFLKIPAIEDKLRNCATSAQLKLHIDESTATQIEQIGTVPALRRYCFFFHVTHGVLTKSAGSFIENDHRSLIKMDRFDCPACVDFDAMVEALRKLFLSFVRESKTRKCTRDLRQREVAHIANQLHALVHGNDDDPKLVYWENKKISFWLWFYKTAELILYDQYVNDFWNKDYILGFYKKEDREALLKETGDDGSFGLFFSDGSPGAITISVLTKKKVGKAVQFEISHVEPFDLRRLKVHGLLQYIEANTPHLTACPKSCDGELRELIRRSKIRDEDNMLPGGYNRAKVFTDDNIKYDGVIVITAPEYKGGVFEEEPSEAPATSGSTTVQMAQPPDSASKLPGEKDDASVTTTTANINAVEFSLEKLSLKDDTVLNADSIQIAKETVLARGSCGIITYRATKTSTNGRESVRTVAVKQSTDRSDVTQQELLINEIKILRHLGSHSNIVAFVGVFTDPMGISIVTENFSQTLSAFLTANKPMFDAKLRSAGTLEAVIAAERETRSGFSFPWSKSSPPSLASVSQQVGIKTMFDFAYQVANGMDYLCSKNVVHGDLAARNILIDEGLVAKIDDFGVARCLPADDYHLGHDVQDPSIVKTSSVKFSRTYDVWSFGWLLFEIFSLGVSCYDHLSKKEGKFWRSSGETPVCVSDASRLRTAEAAFSEQSETPLKPTFAGEKIYSLIGDCCCEDDSARPNFTVCKERIEGEIDELFG